MNSQFTKYINGYKRMVAVLIGASVVSYLAVYMSNVSPPIHNQKSVLFMSILVEAAAIVSTFIRKVPRSRIRGRFLIMALVAYFIAHSVATFSIPTSATNERDVKGFVCTEIANKIYPTSCPLLSIGVLEEASFEPHRLWQEWSISIMKGVLVVLWLCLIWSASRLFAAFTLSINVGKTRSGIASNS